jgi:hypothetical protein
MSGLSRTPGKRVGVNSPPRVRIPLPPPETRSRTSQNIRNRATFRVLLIGNSVGSRPKVFHSVP